ncbi:unnamed protein product [Arctia plantaginis]|uniref:O-acyltransferase n=1 Tax=Arctia plantaginis TaxID=874455 RepID=A0A8S0ZTU6_ARCPL|nr:unnamed protein product [Arctia plantaginis]
MGESGVRYRGKSNGQNESNKVPGHEKEVTDEEFVERESPLTVLIESSLHLRAIYHIFVVILVVLFCDTLIYDLVERGKLNVGIGMVIYGFGDIGRGFKLWIYELSVALLFYPLLLVYAWLGNLSRKYPVLRHATTQLGLLGLIGVQLTLSSIPVYDLARSHLELGSSATVSTEMFRFMMKIVSIAVACGPRCLSGKKPLPTFQHYVYFLFAPTLLYRDQYPRTKKIRWGRVVVYVLEVAAILFYNCFLWERFIRPYWSDYGKQRRVEAGTIVRGMFACVLPGVLCFLCGFYCLLHAWLNAWAEILKFGDRLFYEDWWTTSCFSRYYRRWNRVVYCWLRDHIYVPLAPSLGRPVSTFIVFAVSAVAHEVPDSPRLLMSLYSMEHFARKNCPTSKDDSFFIPKSWSCIEVILKPGWTFHNPFSV